MQCYRKNSLKVRCTGTAVPGRKLCRGHLGTKPERPRQMGSGHRSMGERRSMRGRGSRSMGGRRS
jgi:hypothetical protein